jgi:hypothetical protein
LGVLKAMSAKRKPPARHIGRKLAFAMSFASLASVVACGGSGGTEGVKGVETTPSGSSDPSAPSSKPEPRRGKLAPPPAGMSLGQFWPTRVCTRGPGMIVVAMSCTCDSKMTCSVTRKGNVLDLHVTMTQEICKDCGTFQALCAVPPEARPRAGTTKTYRLTVDGKPALDALELPRSDVPATQSCYE